MKALFLRNLRVYFRDRAAVFFSLLSVLLIIMLYALFLGDSWLNSDIFAGRPGARWLMDSWLMAGLLSVVSVTATMGAYGTMVDDRARKIIKDFYSSPLSRPALTGGYILGAYVIGLIMSLFTMALGVAYVALRGGAVPGLGVLLRTLGVIALSALANTSMVLFLISFLRSQNAFGTASTLIGTLLGFLTGIYMPLGQLPQAVQGVIKFVPTAHAAALLRQVLMEEPTRTVFAGAPPTANGWFREFSGTTLTLFGHTFTALEHVLVLAGTFAVFSALSMLSLSRKRT
ncbi:MAG TPA: ABC transporter permease [Candidatus Limnocylindria bacterium]|nr:ABC transporter permease [Candidatus Limnocylindria bacterium]